MEYTNKDLGTLIENIIENMATKDDIAELRTELRADMRQIETGLSELTETVDGMKGYAKELDLHKERIQALEHHSNTDFRTNMEV